MKLRPPRLPDRRLLSLAWAGAVALVAIGVLLGLRAEIGYRREAARQAEVQADILSASVSAALAFDDREAMREYVNGLRANSRIASAAVYGAQGRAVVVFHRPGAKPPPARVACGITRAQRRLIVIRPVEEGGQPLGWVYLETSPESWDELLGRHAALALLTVMAFLLLGFLTAAAERLRARARQLALANARLRQEIAARGQAEDALRQSQKMEALGQLTGGIAHDFNNLLQVMQGAFDLIRRRPQDPRVATWAENGVAAAERGASLTRQLLTFSRSQKLELQAFVVADLVSEMRELLQRTLGAETELRLELGEGDAHVRSDRTQLELAILNMAINARDAMLGGGQLTLSTRVVAVPAGHGMLEAGDYVELRVADTGGGMTPEVMQRAFDPFFTTKDIGKGTGLGLSQVYGVARQAGGEARLESTPGGGVTVILLLRRWMVAGKTAAAPAEPEATVPARPPAGAEVLVVDDEPGVRELTCETLRVLGYRVLEAASGRRALDILETNRPDVVLMDYAMPGLNGAETARQARRRWPDLPIVFASGHADTSDVETALGGEARILHKPFDFEALARAVAAAVPAGGVGESGAPPPQ